MTPLAHTSQRHWISHFFQRHHAFSYLRTISNAHQQCMSPFFYDKDGSPCLGLKASYSLAPASLRHLISLHSAPCSFSPATLSFHFLQNLTLPSASRPLLRLLPLRPGPFLIPLPVWPLTHLSFSFVSHTTISLQSVIMLTGKELTGLSVGKDVNNGNPHIRLMRV